MTILLSFSSCSDSDSPKGEKYPVRADIIDAQSLILSRGSATRGGEDDKVFKEAGLYKVDKDGNVSAVAVYLHEDGSTSEEVVRAVPRLVTQLSDKYVMLVDCELRNTFGNNVVWPTPTMIVDLSSGKIYKYETGGRRIWQEFAKQISESSFLIWNYGDDWPLEELNIGNGTATCLQITTDDRKGFLDGRKGHSIVNRLQSGVILSEAITYSYNEKENQHPEQIGPDVAMLYPNGGYEYLKDVIEE